MGIYGGFSTIYALVVVIRTLWRRVQKTVKRVFRWFAYMLRLRGTNAWQCKKRVNGLVFVSRFWFFADDTAGNPPATARWFSGGLR